MDVSSKSVKGLARVSRAGVFDVLRRDPDAYNRAAADGSSLLEQRPDQLAKLFENAAGRRDETGGPWIDPIGAAALDQAFGGLIFGDEIARASAEGEDAASRIGGMLELAAERQADGLSAAVLAQWLRDDATRVAPVGPAAVARDLRSANRPWATLHDAMSRPRASAAKSGGRAWVSEALNRRLQAEPTVRSAAQEETPAAVADETGVRTGSSGGPGDDQPPWRVPGNLRWVMGSRIWRHRSLAALFITVTTGLLVISAAQFWADRTGMYAIRPQDVGIDPRTADLIARILTLLAVALLGYLLISIIVAIATRRWAKSFRFERYPKPSPG